VVSVRDLARTLTNSGLYYLFTNERLDLDPALTRALVDYQRITFNVLVLGKWPRAALLSPHYLICKRRSLNFVRQLRKQYQRQPPQSGFFKAALANHAAHPERKESDLEFAFLAPFWAGLDTLGSSLVFLIHQLVHNRELDFQVRSEIDRAVRDNEFHDIPAAAALRKLPKLFGLCMETLRLYPVGFGNGRNAARDFDFGGYHIRKGEDLLVLTSATHFDSHYFPRPKVFDIGRYAPPRNEHRTKYAFNPYGRGTHICLGAGMAESLMLTTVATLLHRFEFEAVAPKKRYPMIFDPSPTLSGAFKIRMRERITPVAASPDREQRERV
jgi:cytochrome P450